MYFLKNLKNLILIICILISVAYFTIAERKIMGSTQIRKGPNVVGFIGLSQPLADGAKLFSKELILPNSADELLFILAPLMSLILSIMGWLVIPFGYGLFLCDLNLGIIYIFVISALTVYSLLFAGWSSNSKYSYLGAIRSVSQMISYEIAIGFASLNIVIPSRSYNLSKIVISQKKMWNCFPFSPIMVVFCIAILAETNRHPFDLPEAESELVSGYNVEYSGIPFAQFFLGEYSNMLLMSVFGSVLFFGGWFLNIMFFLPEFCILGFKGTIGIIYFVLNRAFYPRLRYDQLMPLGWKFLLPLTLGYLVFAIGYLLSINGLP